MANKKNDVDFYTNLWTKDWFDMERLNPTARHLERIIVQLMKPLKIKTVLDAGCGIGVNVKNIKNNFKNLKITGTDLSPQILNLAKHYVGKNSRINYKTLDLGKKHLNKKFDLVLCSQVLEHVKDDKKAMKNLAKMSLKYLLITVPGGKYNNTSKLVGHYRHYSKKRILDLVKKNNFKILYVKEWGFPFHSLYKSALNLLSNEQKRKVGLGKYGFSKKSIAGLLYLLFYGNVFDKGDNVIVLAEKMK